MAAAGVRVRLARNGDMDACVALAHAGRGERASAARPRFEADLTEPRRALFVAEVHGAFAGYGRVAHFSPPAGAPANVAPEGYYLFGLLVDPARRRRGTGLALTFARLDWALDRAPVAWCFANARNEASLALHRRAGFAEVTRDFTFPGVEFDGGTGVLCRAVRGAP